VEVARSSMIPFISHQRVWDDTHIWTRIPQPEMNFSQAVLVVATMCGMF
jgi:hypothetical protein